MIEHRDTAREKIERRRPNRLARNVAQSVGRGWDAVRSVSHRQTVLRALVHKDSVLVGKALLDSDLPILIHCHPFLVEL